MDLPVLIPVLLVHTVKFKDLDLKDLTWIEAIGLGLGLYSNLTVAAWT